MTNTTKRRKNPSRSLRMDVFERDRYSCRYCGFVGDAHQLHVDHIIALARGGTNNYENLVASCLKCNLTKNATPGGFLIQDASPEIQAWWQEFLKNPPPRPARKWEPETAGNAYRGRGRPRTKPSAVHVVRLLETTWQSVDALAARLGVSKRVVMEQAIQEKAEREGINEKPRYE